MFESSRIEAVRGFAGGDGVTVAAQWQSPAGVMQKAGHFFGRAGHLKFTNVKSVKRGQINRASRFDVLQHGVDLLWLGGYPGEQAPQAGIGRTAVHFGQQINQELWLRSVVRGVTVDVEETQQAIDEVVDGGPDIGLLLALLRPARRQRR